MDFNKEKKKSENQDYLFGLSDEDLINKIIQDGDHISIIYQKYYESFVKTLSSINKDIDIQTIQDVVTDSILDLNVKILEVNVGLLKKERYTLKKYLFGICKNKIRNERKGQNTTFLKMDIENQNGHYDGEGDSFENIITNQIHDDEENNELVLERGIIDEKTSIMIQTLNKIKSKGGKCYSIIVLSLSKNYNYKISDLTRIFKYNSDASTRNQKYKCIKRFKKFHSQFQLA